MHIQGMLAIVLAYLVQICTGSCDFSWSVENVLHCLYNVTYGLNGTNVLAGTDTDTIRTFCDDGTFENTVVCLEDLYSSCDSTQALERMAVPDLWRSEATRLCSRLSEHAKQSACIVRYRGTILSCLAHNDVLFAKSAVEHNTVRKFTIGLCSFFGGIRLCTSEPVVKLCDAHVGRILSDFIAGISPRLCDPKYIYIGSESGSTQRFLHTVCLILSVFIATVFGQRINMNNQT